MDFLTSHGHHMREARPRKLRGEQLWDLELKRMDEVIHGKKLLSDDHVIKGRKNVNAALKRNEDTLKAFMDLRRARVAPLSIAEQLRTQATRQRRSLRLEDKHKGAWAVPVALPSLSRSPSPTANRSPSPGSRSRSRSPLYQMA